MGCRLKLRRCGQMLAILLAVGLTGCAGTEEVRPPAEVLSIAAAGLEGVDRYTFRSRTAVRSGGIELAEIESYEGEIAGHAVRSIRGLSGEHVRDLAAAPAARLKELAMLDAEIGYAEHAPEGCVALRVKPAGDAAAREVRERLTRQFELAAEMAASGLSDGTGEAEAFRRAAAEETARFRQELNRALTSLEAETNILVTIDRKTMLPLSIEETTVLRYEAGGRTRTEEWASRTTLEGFDGRPSS